MHQIDLPFSDEEKIRLAGEGEANFITLEKALDVKLITRNPGITVQANDPKAAQLAADGLEKLRDALKAGHQITDYYVRELVGQEQGPDASEFDAHLEKPVLIDRYGTPVQPKTRGQARFIKLVKGSDIVLAGGPAGTGKTFLAVALAVSALEKKIVDRLILCRPAVESGESLGFLPGVISEKIAPYMRPLYDALSVMLPPEKLREYTETNTIEIAPLAYMRGRTLARAFIILDEAQNTTIAQMKMFLTRLGLGSKAVLTGDETQVDLGRNEKSGFAHARKILAGITGIAQIQLDVRDVVRHQLVRDIILAYEKSGYSS